MTDPVEAVAAALDDHYPELFPDYGGDTIRCAAKDCGAGMYDWWQVHGIALRASGFDVVPTGDVGLDVVNAARAYRDWVMGPEVSESEELERWAVLDDALHAYDARLSSSDTGGRPEAWEVEAMHDYVDEASSDNGGRG